MTRHSKNNTSSSVFTYAEKSKLSYGSIEKRHTRDTVKEYDACYLCFMTAIFPVCCNEGHISCKECILSTLLSQKVASKESEAMEFSKNNKIKELQMEEARKEAINKERDFILAVDSRCSMNPSSSKRQPPSASCSFWIPEKTPNAPMLENGAKPSKPASLCHGGSTPHPVSLRALISLKFSFSSSSTEEKICPGCLHSLNNNMLLIAYKSCGDVVCNECFLNSSEEADQISKSFSCLSCGHVNSHSIKLSKEGTGFASGGGQVVIHKYELPFQ